jgi:hypothetical protein
MRLRGDHLWAMNRRTQAAMETISALQSPLTSLVTSGRLLSPFRSRETPSPGVAAYPDLFLPENQADDSAKRALSLNVADQRVSREELKKSMLAKARRANCLDGGVQLTTLQIKM